MIAFLAAALVGGVVIGFVVGRRDIPLGSGVPRWTPPDPPPAGDRDRPRVIQWLGSLSNEEFARVVYEADGGGYSRFLLADVDREAGGKGNPRIRVVALNRYREPWKSDAPLEELGACVHCGITILGQSKDVACPVCGAKAFGT
jgi:hypothetical protein